MGISFTMKEMDRKGWKITWMRADKREINYFNWRRTKMTKIVACRTLRNFVVRPSGLLTGGYVARYRLPKFAYSKLHN